MQLTSKIASYASILLVALTIISTANRAEGSSVQASTLVTEKGAKYGFQADLSTLRKQTISVCNQFIAGKPSESKERLIADIDAIIAHWNTIAETYRNNPPAEYSKDPAWTEYLETALDNFQIMRAKADAGNYDRAKEFCGANCGLFVTMNHMNGIDKVSDRMFMLRKTMKDSVAMQLAGNSKGAVDAVKQADAILVKLADAQPPTGVAASKFDADVSKIREAFGVLRVAIDGQDTEAALPALMTFVKTFGEVYIQYV